MSVVGERTWRELKGESCLELEMLPPDKSQYVLQEALVK